MMKFLAHDTVNDIAIIQTSFAIHVRYGLENSECSTITDALRVFRDCQRHALAANHGVE